jgi:PPP family 3-phenylpropionic acid transporter
VVAVKASRIVTATALRLSILWSCLFAAVGIHLPYFTVWLASQGLSNKVIAQAVAVPMLLRILTTPAIATIADRHGIARTLGFAAMAACLSYTALSFAPGPALVFIGAVAVGLAQGVMPSLADALTLTEIRRLQNAGLRTLDYGRIRVFASLSVLITMLGSGALVMLLPGREIIWLLVGISIFPAAAAIWNARQSRPARLNPRDPGKLTASPDKLQLAIVCIAAAALVQASHAEVYTFGTLHWRALGLSPSFIGIAWASGVACESVFFVAVGRLSGGERGAAVLLILGGAGATIRWTAMSFDPPAGLLLVLQGMHALSFAATYTGSVILLGSLAGPHHRARMQGWLASAAALATALATMAAGVLTDSLGERAYLVMAGLALCGLALAVLAGVLKRRLDGRGRSAPERRVWGMDGGALITQPIRPVARKQQRPVEIDEFHLRHQKHGGRHGERCRDHAARHEIKAKSLGRLGKCQSLGQAARLIELDIDRIVALAKRRKAGPVMNAFIRANRHDALHAGETRIRAGRERLLDKHHTRFRAGRDHALERVRRPSLVGIDDQLRGRRRRTHRAEPLLIPLAGKLDLEQRPCAGKPRRLRHFRRRGDRDRKGGGRRFHPLKTGPRKSRNARGFGIQIPQSTVHRITRGAWRQDVQHTPRVASSLENGPDRLDLGDDARDRFAIAGIGDAFASPSCTAPARAGTLERHRDHLGLRLGAAGDDEPASDRKGFDRDFQSDHDRSFLPFPAPSFALAHVPYGWNHPCDENSPSL